MEFKNLFDDDRAVSPVIGVILMVAITVILAAVIGTFVLGLGDQVQSTSPQASFGFESTTYTTAGGSTAFPAVTITHETGDTLDANNIGVNVDGATAYTADTSVTPHETQGTFSGEVSAGSSVTIVAATNEDVTTGTDTLKENSNRLDIDTANDGTTTANYEGVSLSSGDTVRVVYNNPDSDSSTTLGKFEVQ